MVKKVKILILSSLLISLQIFSMPEANRKYQYLVSEVHTRKDFLELQDDLVKTRSQLLDRTSSER